VARNYGCGFVGLVILFFMETNLVLFYETRHLRYTLLGTGFILSASWSALAKTYSFAIFGLCVGWCELQKCMAFSVGFCIIILIR